MVVQTMLMFCRLKAHHLDISLLLVLLLPQVYNAEFGGHLLAVKLFRYSTAMDYASGAHPSQLHGGPGAAAGAAAAGIGSLLGHPGAGGSSSGGNWASEAELEAVLSLQYRLCNMSHPHLLQHVAVYPRVYEVSTQCGVRGARRIESMDCPFVCAGRRLLSITLAVS